MADRVAGIAGGVLGAFSLALAALHAYHAIEEFGDTFAAVLYGALLPLLVALLLLGSGVWIARRPWRDVSPWRFVWWCGAGAFVGVGLSELLIQYQAAEGVALSDRWFVLAMFATYGAAMGAVIGRYDVQRLARYAEEARQRDRLEEFASLVSHDLRNPLNVAQGRLDLARSEADSAHLEDVDRSLNRMQVLIDDLLALAREGERIGEPERVRLNELAEVCWRTVETAEARFAVEGDGAFMADRTRLQQLLENLIRNAVEHGGGEVTVRVGALEDGFYVEDDGPGIPEDLRDRIFAAGFSTTDAGTGFGLAIAREIAEAQGWELEVTDGRDGGARFEITAVEMSA